VEQLDEQVAEMFEKLKNPDYVNWYGSQGKIPMIYESLDKGETVYARPFGSPHNARVLVKGDMK